MAPEFECDTRKSFSLSEKNSWNQSTVSFCIRRLIWLNFRVTYNCEEKTLIISHQKNFVKSTLQQLTYLNSKTVTLTKILQKICERIPVISTLGVDLTKYFYFLKKLVFQVYVETTIFRQIISLVRVNFRPMSWEKWIWKNT